MGMRTVFNRWLWVILWCGLIFWFSSIPNYTGKGVNFETFTGILDFSCRKVAHFFEYAVLMILLYRAVQMSWRQIPQTHFLLCFSFSVLYAISDEIHQSTVFGRSGNSFDVFVDALGALCGYALYRKKEIQRSPLN